MSYLNFLFDLNGKSRNNFGRSKSEEGYGLNYIHRFNDSTLNSNSETEKVHCKGASHIIGSRYRFRESLVNI